jgi:hypothetical protein
MRAQPLNNVQNNPASNRMSLGGPKLVAGIAATTAGAGGRKSLAGRQSLAPTNSRFVQSLEVVVVFFCSWLFSNFLPLRLSGLAALACMRMPHALCIL